jgi:hypothetical protein
MEAEELTRGIDLSLHPDISQSVLIASGLDLEGNSKWLYLNTTKGKTTNSWDRRRVRAVSEAMGLHVSDIQKGTLMWMRNVLCRKIETWRSAQVLYIPAVQILATTIIQLCGKYQI